MTAQSREKIEKAIKRGPYSVQAGEWTLMIRERRGRYEISATRPPDKVHVWVYRSLQVAVDRFEEHVNCYSGKPRKEKR